VDGKLGVAPDLFANHIYYWGDAHADHTVGPARAARMNPAASALRHGLRFAFHFDSWVTPIEPLRTVWVAATRRTLSGRELGRQERIGVNDALRAVTIDAAYLLKEDDIKGSIERRQGGRLRHPRRRAERRRPRRHPGDRRRGYGPRRRQVRAGSGLSRRRTLTALPRRRASTMALVALGVRDRLAANASAAADSS
jgi:hypothetical protein